MPKAKKNRQRARCGKLEKRRERNSCLRGQRKKRVKTEVTVGTTECEKKGKDVASLTQKFQGNRDSQRGKGKNEKRPNLNNCDKGANKTWGEGEKKRGCLKVPFVKKK